MNDKATDENRETGVHVAEFVPDVKELNPGLTSEELWAALESLTNREIVHTTISEEYYRCIY